MSRPLAAGRPAAESRAVADQGTRDRGTSRRRAGTAPAPFIGPPRPPTEAEPDPAEVPAYGQQWYRVQTDPTQARRAREEYASSRLLPPFFDPQSGQVRAKAARDAYNQWANLTGDFASFNEELGMGLLTVREHFDAAYEDDPDYIDQYHVSLEHMLEHPPFLRMGPGVPPGGVRALTRYLAVLFPRLVAHGRQVMGLYRIGSTGGARGHHIFAKAAFPKSVWRSMLAISHEALDALGWKHARMSATQGALYRALFRRGSHTMKDHITIASAALRAGGATRLQRRWIIAQALRNLRQADVRRPLRIPTFGRPPRR